MWRRVRQLFSFISGRLWRCRATLYPSVVLFVREGGGIFQSLCGLMRLLLAVDSARHMCANRSESPEAVCSPLLTCLLSRLRLQ